MALQPKIAGSDPGPSGHTAPAVAPGQRQRVCTAPNLRDRSEESVDLASPNDCITVKIAVFAVFWSGSALSLLCVSCNNPHPRSNIGQ